MNDGLARDEGLPWLEAVDDEDGPRGVSSGKMLAALAMVLVAAAVIAGSFFVLGRSDPAPTGAPELIRAEPGPYKVRPDDPGGLDVAGDSGTAFATGAGEDPDAALDTEKLPPAAAAEPAPEAPLKAEPKPEPATPPATTGGPTIQLGAYNNATQAERAWTSLSSRFPELGDLQKQVVTATSNGRTVVRLRATGANAAAVCQAVRAGGEACIKVQ